MFGQDSIECFAIDADVGSVHERIAWQTEIPSHADLEIGINVKYLLSVVEKYRSPRLCFQLVDALSPIIVTEQSEQPQQIYLLMPMRLKDEQAHEQAA